MKILERLEELGSVEFDQNRYKAVFDQVKNLEAIRSHRDQMRGELSRLPVVREALDGNDRKLCEIKQEIIELEKNLEEISYHENDFLSAQESFQNAQNEFEQARDEYLSITKEKELSEKELQGKQEQLKVFEKAARELEDTRTNQYYGEKLALLLAQFRTSLIAGIRPTLADFSSRLISEMTNGKYNLVELDEKYNLRVMDYGQFYGVDRFSGGEKDLANLCLRLAISLALTEAAGLSRSFIILDEIFGSQDNERKELIVRSLANLKHRFPQVLLITHVEDIRDQVEQTIEVMPTTAGWSEIKVNGNQV